MGNYIYEFPRKEILGFDNIAMDSAGAAAGDDQGSGWFEVKKKHRSSSKFSIQNWVGGSSRQQVNGKGGNSNDKHRSHLPRRGKDFVQRGAANHSFSTEENKKDPCCLDKCVVDDGNGHLNASSLTLTTGSESTSTGNENVTEKKPDMVRIKWGDLEDDVLASGHGSSAVEIKFGEIGDDDLAMCGKSRNVYDLGSCNLSQNDPVVDINVEEGVDAACDTCHKSSLSPIEGSLGDNCKDICEVTLNDVKTTTTSKEIDTKLTHLHKDLAENDVEPTNTDSLCAEEVSDDEFQCSSIGESAKIVEIQAPILLDGDDVALSAARADDVDANSVVIAENSELVSSDQSPLEVSGNPNSVDLPNGTSTNNLTKAPRCALGEPEEGESRERFRERLWCFLFENLNRAIDELYLLCELECDLEQVKEAILVLQEAESDFRELNIRVQEFEKMKKNSSQSASGAAMSTKGDHRRPHALSWEVRRMTTSPHRAEILSSSLEAFKKIQEERAKERVAGDVRSVGPKRHSRLPVTTGTSNLETRSRRQNGISDSVPVNMSKEKISTESGRSNKMSFSSSDPKTTKLPSKGKKEQLGLGSSTEVELKRYSAFSSDKDKEKRNSMPWRPVDAWKEKRNWEEILASPCRLSSRMSHSPSMSRRSAERARILHDKLMSPEKKKKTSVDLKKEAEEKHARAMRIRSELENERVQKLQRTSEKLNRVSEWQAVRSMKLREGMYARHQRSESRHEAYIAQVVKRAGDESIKVNEVRFITSLNEENKKFLLRQKLHGSEVRRAEKFQVLKTKQKEDMAREEAVMERRKLIEAEKLHRLAETQRRKEEAQLRREEERKASSAAREARVLEQLRRKEERAKAQQEEAELLAQRLAERLSESEQRRKVYLEQIRERASIVNKEGQGRSTPPGNAVDDNQANSSSGVGVSGPANNSAAMQQSLKRRIKKIRQRLMALKHEVVETSVPENMGIGYRTAMTTARVRVTKWVQDLQRLRQERKEGAASIGVITAEIIKFLEGKELELQAARHAGLLDFISSALPASHISKPEACQVTIYLLRLLKVALSVPANRSYFLAQNLLPPLIPMLLAALESYIKIAASLNAPGSSSLQPSKTSSENFDSISEVLDGFLWTVMVIIGLPTLDERQIQMQDGLLELVVSYQIIHRLRDLFALYDRPQVEGSPFPSSILLSKNLLVVLTSRPCPNSSINWGKCFPKVVMPDSETVSRLSGVPEDKQCGEFQKTTLVGESVSSEMQAEKEQGNISQKDEKNSADNGIGRKDESHTSVKQPHAFLLSAISETGLVSLPSLLTAALLQANNRLSSEQGSYILPSNFEEIATGVLKVLNNLALMDITFLQQMLARSDLKMEFFHIMSFLLTHCTSNWKVASDKVGVLLLESLLLLGYFSLFHTSNQAVLRWGNSPTILHKVCDLPFAFFSDLELMPILAGTLVAACFGCEQNKGVVQQELSTEMILSLVKSCRSSSPLLLTAEPRKLQSDMLVKLTRSTARSSRLSLAKGGAAGSSSTRNGKVRNPRDSKTSKILEDTISKQKMAVLEASATLPLYARFPGSFVDRAEQFFSVEPSSPRDAAHA